MKNFGRQLLNRGDIAFVPEKIFSIPDKRRWIVFLQLSIAVVLFFAIVYSTTNFVAQQNPSRWVRLYFAWELDIPLVPEMIVFYISVLVLTVLPLVTSDEREMKALAVAMAFVTVVAGMIFVAFPCELGFQRTLSVDHFTSVFRYLYSLDLPHNLVPSLHVTYGTLTVLALCRKHNTLWRAFLSVWLILICLSVLFVHQHHLADVFGGWFLAAAAYRWVFVPALQSNFLMQTEVNRVSLERSASQIRD